MATVVDYYQVCVYGDSLFHRCFSTACPRIVTQSDSTPDNRCVPLCVHDYHVHFVRCMQHSRQQPTAIVLVGSNDEFLVVGAQGEL